MWTYHFFNANGKIASYKEKLIKVSEAARADILKYVPEQAVDIVFKHDPTLAIPGIGMGGMALQKDEIFVGLDQEYENIDAIIEQELKHTLAHE